jgi:hypothetical protein
MFLSADMSTTTELQPAMVQENLHLMVHHKLQDVQKAPNDLLRHGACNKIRNTAHKQGL